jgi:hypothetical protein
MFHLRAMLTSVDTAAIGGAYWALCAFGPGLPAYVRRAMSDAHAKITSSMQPFAPPPMCRVASHHSPWS